MLDSKTSSSNSFVLCRTIRGEMEGFKTLAVKTGLKVDNIIMF